MQIFSQVAGAVHHLHSLGIYHRDLKLENILIDERQHIKLIDFGFSIKSNPSENLKMYCGTPSYMAPELVGKRDYKGWAVDVWALGIILYTILSGYFPFRGNNEKDMF